MNAEFGNDASMKEDRAQSGAAKYALVNPHPSAAYIRIDATGRNGADSSGYFQKHCTEPGKSGSNYPLNGRPGFLLTVYLYIGRLAAIDTQCGQPTTPDAAGIQWKHVGVFVQTQS